MTNIITYTDFTGDIRLGITATDVGEIAVLNAYIAKYQEELFIKLLGRNLYASLDVDHVPDKWTELITPGTVYFEYSGYKFKFPGLKIVLAHYVYFHYNRLETTSPTIQGESVAKNTNGDVIINAEKQARAFNKAVDLADECLTYIEYKNSVTPDYFEGFEPCPLKEINSFGI